MSSIPFRLQRVLDYRRQREREQQARLAAAAGARLAAEADLAATHASQRGWHDAMVLALADAGSGSLGQAARQLEAWHARAVLDDRVLDRSVELEHEARRQLVERTRSRKVLDLARDRFDARVREESLRLEAREQDELTAARGLGGGGNEVRDG